MQKILNFLTVVTFESFDIFCIMIPAFLLEFKILHDAAAKSRQNSQLAILAIFGGYFGLFKEKTSTDLFAL